MPFQILFVQFLFSETTIDNSSGEPRLGSNIFLGPVGNKIETRKYQKKISEKQKQDVT